PATSIMGRRLPNRLTVSGVPSQGDGQGESQRSNLDVLALCLDVLDPRSTLSPRSSLCANRSRWRTIGRTSRRTTVPVIDVQVHPFDRNHPGRPWASPSHGLDSASGGEMVAAMNSVGVDGAIMVSSFSAYEYNPSYALEVYN